jgi:pSer/pThr/pTyr-binding forkhead associated (FHA) protein/ribosomal protein L12E/L44/L45/RPP1/RPP2
MKLIIEDDEGRKTVVPLVRDEITIGRQEGNTIRLTERNVSRRHARLVKQNGSIFIEDLGSYNGVIVNGERIQGRTAIKEGDLVEIGDYDLGIQGEGDAAAAPAAEHHEEHHAPEHVEHHEKTQPAASIPERRPQPAEPPARPTPSAAHGSAMDPNATAVIRVGAVQPPADAGEARDLPRSQQPRIVCIAGPLRGKEFNLARTVVKVGRQEGDIVVDHQSISRNHCQFLREANGSWKVQDLKSANGVRVNGEDYAVSAVRSGDTVELGHVKFKFVGPGEQFTMPKEAAVARGAAEEEIAAPKKPMGIIIGAGAAVLVLAAVAIFFATRGPSGPKEAAVAPEAQAAYDQAQSAMGLEKWAEASRLFRRAQDLGMPAAKVGSLIEKCDLETRAKQNFDGAERAFSQSDPGAAYEKMQRVPAESQYYPQAQSKIPEYKDEAIRLSQNKAQELVDKGKFEEALAEVLTCLGFDPENTKCKALQTLIEKKLSEAPPKPKVAAAPPPAAAPKAPQKSPEEREAEANELLKAANADILKQDYRSALEKLGQAEKLQPSNALKAKIYRSQGVINARMGDNCKAAEYYKKYIAADPGTKERPYIEKMLDQVEKSGACK